MTRAKSVRGVISTEVVIKTSCADPIIVVGLKYEHKNFSTKFTNVQCEKKITLIML